MGTAKRYPTTAVLASALAAAGLEVRSQARCPALTLTSAELESRYGLSPSDADRIRREFGASFGDVPGVFEAGPGGFVACLHYRLFVTRAAGIT